MSNVAFREKIYHPALQFHSSSGAACIGWAVLMILCELPYLCVVKLSKIGAQYLANRYFHKKYNYKENWNDFLVRFTLMGSSDAYNSLVKKSRKIWKDAYDEMSSFVKSENLMERFHRLLDFVQEVERWETVSSIFKDSWILKSDQLHGKYFQSWIDRGQINTGIIIIDEGYSFSVAYQDRNTLLNDMKSFFPSAFSFAKIIKKQGKAFGEMIVKLPLINSNNSFRLAYHGICEGSGTHLAWKGWG